MSKTSFDLGQQNIDFGAFKSIFQVQIFAFASQGQQFH